MAKVHKNGIALPEKVPVPQTLWRDPNSNIVVPVTMGEEYTGLVPKHPGAKPRHFRAELTPGPAVPVPTAKPRHKEAKTRVLATPPAATGSPFNDASGKVSMRQNLEPRTERYRGWVHEAIAYFGEKIRALGFSKADIEAIFMRMMNQESKGDPNASNGGCIGLCQLSPAAMSETISKYQLQRQGVKNNAYDPRSNIWAGVGYYVSCLKQHGDYRTACAAYNWGPYNRHVKAKDEANYRGITKAYVEIAMDLPKGTIPRGHKVEKAGVHHDAKPVVHHHHHSRAWYRRHHRHS